MRLTSPRLPLLVVLTWTAVSCSISDRIIVRDQGEARKFIGDARLLEAYPQLDLMDDAAILSAVVYEDDGAPAARSLAEYCRTQDTIRFDPEQRDWVEETRLPPLPKPPAGVRLIPDLHYRVWTKEFADGRKVAMLVFRGTRSGADWFSNLRWITRVVPNRLDHYEQYAKVATATIEAIRQHHPTAEIVAAGHSLGGGLAQLAGYSSNGAIRKVYAFDPSIVTYFYGVEPAVRETSVRDQHIYRIFEQGEILSYVRWIMKRFYPISHEHPRIVQVKFRRLKAGLIGDHSIRRFACASPTASAAVATASR